MSKKKNTLKDLDEFLKQQAATLVTPAQLSDTLSDARTEMKNPQASEEELKEVSAAGILKDLKALAEKEGPSFRNRFYDLIVQSIEAQNNSLPEDKMLINTALYLKSGEKWKEVIRQYWKGRNY